MMRLLRIFLPAALVILCVPSGALAQERLCDTKFEDCREPVLQLIRNETQGIDVAFWFMEDGRYVADLIKRHDAGVPVRILVDQRANNSKRLNEEILTQLRNAGIPMRDKYVGDILHFKMMLFQGQNVVQFSKANYNHIAFVPVEPNVNYDDEAIFFTNDNNLTNSFRRRFDDLWINTSQYQNFGNVNGPLVRTCQSCTIHPSMNFVPLEDYSNRAVSRYNAEMLAIDALVFRVTDHRQANAMISAVERGTPVRLITEPSEYRNPARVWHSKHVDRMYMGGVQIKHRKHAGLMHQASVVMHGLGEVIFGSSNWTTASAGYQDEHNYFYNPSLNKPWFYLWFADQFNAKWNDATNYGPFQPLPPDAPAYASPVNGTGGVSSSVTLTWDGGPWAHLYDIYLGTTPNPPLLDSNRELGSPLAGQVESLTVSDLLPGTTYYWRVVGKTWAQLVNSGPVWSFTTAGTAPGGGGGGGGTPAYGGTPAAVPGTFQAEHFDEGGQGIAYYDTTSGNKGNVFRATDVDLEATNDTGAGYNVGWTKAGEWLTYTVNVQATGTYTLETRLAAAGSGGSFRVEVDGVDRTGPLAVPNTSGWQTWQTLTTTGIPLTAGQRVIRVVFIKAGAGGSVGNFNWFRFSSGGSTPPPPTNTAPVVTIASPSNNASFTSGSAVTFSGSASDAEQEPLSSSLVWTSSRDGQIGTGASFSRSNLTVGTHTITATATDSGGLKGSAAVTITVTTAPTPPPPTNTAPVVTIASPSNNASVTSGSSVTFSGSASDAEQGTLSSSLVWTSSRDGQIGTGASFSRSNLTVGTHTITATATDSGGLKGSAAVTITVNTAPTPPPPNPAYGGTPVALPGIVEAENFDIGGQGVAYYDVNAGNSGGVYRTTDVDIGANIGGGYHLGWARLGEWVNYTVNVTQTRQYTLDVRVANLGSGGAFRVEVDGVDRTGPIAVPNTGGWDAWQMISVSGISMTQGQRVVRIVMVARNVENSSVGNFDFFQFR